MSRRAIITDISNGKEKTPVICSDKYLKRLEAKFNYKEKYIGTSYLEKGDIDDYSLSEEYSCDCENGKCSPYHCNCIQSHLQKYECNINCTCTIYTCQNRIVQNGINKKLEVFYINKQKGFGVKSLDYIKKDEYVCEYVGEIIHKDKALERIQRNLIKRAQNYVLQVRENYEKIIISTYIDAEEFGNVSRFLNHSCDPNLYFDIVRIDHFIPRIAFYAIKDINLGEELTFSYCDIENIKNNDSFSLSYKECQCNSENCIKYLPN
jgi:SET domain-containing protein